MSDDKGLLEKLYAKVEKISDDQSDMKITLAKQEENLRQHMRRSDLLEEGITVLKTEMEPIKHHVALVGAIGKWLISGGAVTLIGLVVKYVMGY